MYTYAIELFPDDNDTFLATCPAFPEVATFGNSRAEAVEQASDAIVEAMAARIADKEPIPEPEAGGMTARIPTRVAMKAAIHNRMLQGGVTKYRLMKIMGVHQPQIDRLLDVRYNTNLDMMDKAMEALHASFVINDRDLDDDQPLLKRA